MVDEQTPFCDIYLGIMSSRFGGDGTRESGTEHELRQALDRFGETTQPWVLVYFNDEPPRARSSAESKQQTRVLEFREELEKKGIVGSYAGVRGTENGFFERVELHLRQMVQRPEFASPTLERREAPRGPRTPARPSASRIAAGARRGCRAVGRVVRRQSNSCP